MRKIVPLSYTCTEVQGITKNGVYTHGDALVNYNLQTLQTKYLPCRYWKFPIFAEFTIFYDFS